VKRVHKRRRRSRSHFLILTTAAVVAGLVPLYGDPRQSPVTHPEWARMVLRGLDLEEALAPSTRASHVFSALSWRESLAYPAGHYLRSAGMELHERADGTRLLTVVDPIGGEATYHMAVVRGGTYRFRARVSGTSELSGHVMVDERSGGLAQRMSFGLPADPGWVDIGARHLDPGVYYASFQLPEGCDLEYVELAPPCLNPVEPLGGWRPTSVAHVYDVAVTTLQALDMEHELPPAATPIEHGAEDFVVIAGEPEPLLASAPERLDAYWLRGGASGREAILKIDIPTDGLYSVYAFADVRGGQSWTADGCQKAVLCPSNEPPRWWPVLSNRFDAGTHSLAVNVGPGSVVQRVRIVKKKDSPLDYIATLESLGLELGEAGPITRPKAVEAMEFIGGKRAEAWGEFCGDIPPADSLGARVAGDPSASIQGPGSPPPFGGNPLPPGGNPLGPPSEDGLPPGITLPPASPVIP
jgi:hypothetical protein